LVELNFVEMAGGSKVILRHTGWEKLGEKAARVRNEYDAGWEFVLGKCYREFVLAKAKNVGTV
jgi:hypothetical protein